MTSHGATGESKYKNRAGAVGSAGSVRGRDDLVTITRLPGDKRGLW